MRHDSHHPERSRRDVGAGRPILVLLVAVPGAVVVGPVAVRDIVQDAPRTLTAACRLAAAANDRSLGVFPLWTTMIVPVTRPRYDGVVDESREAIQDSDRSARLEVAGPAAGS